LSNFFFGISATARYTLKLKQDILLLVLVGPLRAVYSYNCYILPLVGSVSFGQENKTYRTLVRNVIYFLVFLT
jgi:hypothetical protein